MSTRGRNLAHHRQAGGELILFPARSGDHSLQRSTSSWEGLGPRPAHHPTDQVETDLAELALTVPCAHTVARLRCLRGIDMFTAPGLCSEIGEWERFDHPGFEGMMLLVGRVAEIGVAISLWKDEEDLADSDSEEREFMTGAARAFEVTASVRNCEVLYQHSERRLAPNLVRRQTKTQVRFHEPTVDTADGKCSGQGKA